MVADAFFLVLEKNRFFEKKYFKTLKKQGFSLKKTQFVTDFQYLRRFRNVGSPEKIFFYKNFKKSF